VLVLHNDFDQFEVRRRLGNDKDLENLKKTFERRNSKFKDLKGAKSDEIKSIISNQEKLVGFFFPNGDCKNFLFMRLSYLTPCFY